VSDIESGNPYNEDFNYLDFHRDRFTYIFDLGKKYFSPGAKFLDIGSLFGYVCLGYQQIGYQSYGLDLAKYVKQFASRFASWSIDNRSCDLTSENLPFADQEFDLILASEILEHFRFHPARFFAEVARVLKPGGRLIITTPNLIRLNNVIKLLLGRSINWDIADQYWDGTHAREFTAAEIAQLAKQTGLAVETVTYRNFSYPNLLPVVKIVNSLFGLLWPKRQGNLIVVLRK
jgi:SAM-dependent methyltransferase